MNLSGKGDFNSSVTGFLTKSDQRIVIAEDKITENTAPLAHSSDAMGTERDGVRLFQRRFPRVFLTGVMKESPFVKECQVKWSDRLISGIYDFGRSAVSVYMPMRLNIQPQKGEIIRLPYLFAPDTELQLEGRVIRSETRLVVMELFRLSPSQCRVIQDFFHDERLLQDIYVVPKVAYSPEQTFSLWLHGPLDTNLYFWSEDDMLHRAVLEKGSDVWEWTSNGIAKGPSRDTLSYPTEDYAYYSNTLAPLSAAELKGPECVKFSKFLEGLVPAYPIVSQILSHMGS